MRNLIYILSVFIVLNSCEKETEIGFETFTLESEKSSSEPSSNAKISINVPKATGVELVANKINTVIFEYVANINVIDTDSTLNSSIEKATKNFENEFNSFRADFPEEARPWEFFVDGEVSYQSPEIISIAINSYTDTGGAHGNTIIRFFNFDAQTGKRLNKVDIIDDLEALTKLAKKYFEEEITSKNESQQLSGGDMQDFFYGDDFQLPETIGLNNEGVVMLYNTYEIAAYARGITEFTIPFSEAKPYLIMD